MKIEQLREHPQYIEIVIDWLNEEFGNTKSRNFYQELIKHSLTDNQLPITFVALENDVLLGTVGIWRGDLLSRQELYPWLSALVVNPRYRKSGIGQELQKHALQYCQSKGIKQLYLYTELNGYYEKSGWVSFDVGYEYTGGKVAIYKHSIY
ncbi:MAG: GNAT family N-acetyltransferase [Lachnospiraceae bacterium]|nr:GNAT family N-acetyltransferase [Lachnospiraceae bacterium]